jgi:hypothetical protein
MSLCVPVLSSVAWVLCVISVTPSRAQEAKPKPVDAKTYRVKVETILEPVGKVAIYRVQIWTAEKLDVYIDLEDGAYRGQGLPRPEKDGKHYRADFVLLASLRDPAPPGGKVELEFRCLTGGATGSTNIRDNVDNATQLSKVLEIPAADRVCKLHEKQRVGQFRGKSIEVGVRDMEPDKK